MCLSKEIKTTNSFRSLPQSSRRFSCHDYVTTATRSLVEGIDVVAGGVEKTQESRFAPRLMLLEMFLRTLKYFCASVMCRLNIIARFLYRQRVRGGGGEVKQIVIAYTSAAGRLMALFYFYIIVNKKRDE